MSKKRLHAGILLLYPVAALLVSFWLEPNFLGSIVLFLVLPALHLSLLLPKSILKSIIFAITFIVPLTLTLDYIAHVSQAWYAPTIFSFRIFGHIPLEDLAWGVSLSYFVVMFYEYLFDSHRDTKLWRPRMKGVSLILLGSVVLFLTLLITAPKVLDVPYAYLWIGIGLLLIPTTIELYRRPKLAGKFFLTGAYFFYLSFLYEIAGLTLGWWSFPGSEFIGWVTAFGVTFPLEEFFFWFVMAAMANLSFYEFCDDDEK